MGTAFQPLITVAITELAGAAPLLEGALRIGNLVRDVDLCNPVRCTLVNMLCLNFGPAEVQ